MKNKYKFTESVVVWGSAREIKPLLKELKGVRITGSGMDSCDTHQSVVEISFDPRFVDVGEIFHTISNPETGIGGIANSVRSRTVRM